MPRPLAPLPLIAALALAGCWNHPGECINCFGFLGCFCLAGPLRGRPEGRKKNGSYFRAYWEDGQRRTLALEQAPLVLGRALGALAGAAFAGPARRSRSPPRHDVPDYLRKTQPSQGPVQRCARCALGCSRHRAR
jgi:hypothetical protein